MGLGLAVLWWPHVAPQPLAHPPTHLIVGLVGQAACKVAEDQRARVLLAVILINFCGCRRKGDKVQCERRGAKQSIKQCMSRLHPSHTPGSARYFFAITAADLLYVSRSYGRQGKAARFRGLVQCLTQ